jgi:hypothetical protein
VFPTWQTLGAQAATLGVIAVAFALARRPDAAT